MKQVLIDTDVILDFFFDRKPYAEQAAVILTLCDQKKLKGFVTPVILSNVYYLLRQTASHQRVTGQLAKLLSLVDVLTMDKRVVTDALTSGFTDFEDALQNSAAVHKGTVDVILTRNIRDYRKSKLAVMTPAQFLASPTTPG
jgi:predicted nucleic acid-binding protein